MKFHPSRVPFRVKGTLPWCKKGLKNHPFWQRIYIATKFMWLSFTSHAFTAMSFLSVGLYEIIYSFSWSTPLKKDLGLSKYSRNRTGSGLNYINNYLPTSGVIFLLRTQSELTISNEFELVGPRKCHFNRKMPPL